MGVVGVYGQETVFDVPEGTKTLDETVSDGDAGPVPQDVSPPFSNLL